MKRCLVCGVGYASSMRICPKCQSGPDLLDGFDSFAPALAHDGGDSNLIIFRSWLVWKKKISGFNPGTS